MTNQINNYKIQLKNFKIVKEINRGAFGVVYEVKDKKTDKHFAAKVIKYENEQTKEMTNREIQIMVRISHPTLVKFRGFSLKDFSNNDNITILMDIVERGSLYSILRDSRNGFADKNYDDTSRQIILIGISYGMMVLHKHYVIHRDLKPDNILIDSDFHPHITDFGLSKFYDVNNSLKQSKVCGTSIYMAPEVVNGQCSYNGKADVYSFGMIMYEIVTELIPFPEFMQGKMTEYQFNKKLIENFYRPSFTVPIKSSLKKLIEKCWRANPNDRPTFEEIFNKLAFNLECEVYDSSRRNEDNFGNESGESYYLENADIDDIFLYIDSITNEKVTNNDVVGNCGDSDAIVELKKTISEQQKIIDEMNKKLSANAEFISEQMSINKQLLSQLSKINDQTNEIEEIKRKLENKPETSTIETSVKKINFVIDDKTSSDENQGTFRVFRRKSSRSPRRNKSCPALQQIKATSNR
ncbi:hypothetical protein M9Y10_008061 [Tritrichomonas musculus]|uniref:Protein kinase domain-containing protein n=1 Tax=Tritrichomonas musculus TaxID=1915356 RepID=A0ABR2IX83_9EUKA